MTPEHPHEERYLREALRYEGELKARLLRMTCNYSDTEELLHDTYAKLLTTGADDKPEIRNVRAYAHQIAAHLAIDRLRQRMIVPIELVADPGELDMLDEYARLEDQVIAQQELQLLSRAALELPERCRRVFTLHKIYGYTHAETAQRLGISLHAVKDDLARASHHLTPVSLSRPTASCSKAPLWTLPAKERL
jgi:RNA polymerase sigma factor (sigma-70 family)